MLKVLFLKKKLSAPSCTNSVYQLGGTYTSYLQIWPATSLLGTSVLYWGDSSTAIQQFESPFEFVKPELNQVDILRPMQTAGLLLPKYVLVVARLLFTGTPQSIWLINGHFFVYHHIDKKDFCYDEKVSLSHVLFFQQGANKRRAHQESELKIITILQPLFYIIRYFCILCSRVLQLSTHCSLKSNLANFEVPEILTTDSESPWNGDCKSRVGFALAGCATETVIYL